MCAWTYIRKFVFYVWENIYTRGGGVAVFICTHTHISVNPIVIVWAFCLLIFIVMFYAIPPYIHIENKMLLWYVHANVYIYLKKKSICSVRVCLYFVYICVYVMVWHDFCKCKEPSHAADYMFYSTLYLSIKYIYIYSILYMFWYAPHFCIATA